MAFILDQSGMILINVLSVTAIYVALNNALCVEIDGEPKVLAKYGERSRAEEELSDIIQWMNDPDAVSVYRVGVI
jgi:hypothetical protein